MTRYKQKLVDTLIATDQVLFNTNTHRVYVTQTTNGFDIDFYNLSETDDDIILGDVESIDGGVVSTTDPITAVTYGLEIT